MVARALFFAAALAASPARAEPGDDLSVHVLTFGPGDHPFFKFGHNALLIQPRQGQGMVFNWGTFAFDSPTLIPEFLRGRLMYWLSVAPADETLESYRDENRTIEAQELDLLPAERAALLERVMVNAKPANREYLYDYFWDNCSTRVRDAVDAVVGGKVKATGQAPGSMSLRAHALRMTADLKWEYVGLHFGLGSLTDRPMTTWDEGFLPEKLRDLLRQVRLADGRPLVKSEKVIFQARRAPPLHSAPSWGWVFALVGIGVGAVLALVGRGSRLAMGVLSGLLGLVLGLLGTVLVLLWAFTNHKAAYANANILQVAPFTLALVWFSIGIARGRPVATRRAFRLCVAAAALCVLGLVAKVLPGVSQDNHAFILLALPIWSGMALGLHGRHQRG